MERNNLDIAMLITDAILNEFERNGKVDIPLDEHKYSFPLQDRIQIEYEKGNIPTRESGFLQNLQGFG